MMGTLRVLTLFINFIIILIYPTFDRNNFNLYLFQFYFHMYFHLHFYLLTFKIKSH